MSVVVPIVIIMDRRFAGTHMYRGLGLSHVETPFMNRAAQIPTP
jgi:hypothetical protein